MPDKAVSDSRTIRTAHVLALLGPLALVDVLVQGWMNHLVFHWSPVDWQGWWGLRSVVLWHVGVGALWLLWLRSEHAVRHRRLAYGCLHTYFTVMAMLVVFNAGFFYYLDIQVEAGLLNEILPMIQAGIWTVIKSAVSPVFIIVGVAIVVAANKFPRLVIRLSGLRKREATPIEPAVATADGPTATGSRRTASVIAAVAVVLIAVASLTPDGMSSSRFTRQRLPELVTGVVQEMTAKKLPPTPSADLPLNTYLVPTKRAKRYNVVYIVQESQRANSVSYYNKSLDTTPAFDKLAKTSIVAKHAYTAITHTSKSLVASHCGMTPPLDSSNSEGQPHQLASRCLPRLLEDLGYKTAFFQSPTKDFEHREQMVKNLGFQQFVPLEKMDKHGFFPVNPLGYEDDIMVKPSVDWAKKQKGPFELTYMTVTAHYDYTLPKNFNEKKYDTSDESYNRYLNAVRYQDRFVGKVIKSFKRAGLYKNTIFVVMGDHGEGFREHQRRIHNDTIWMEGIHIPLLIRVPGMKKSNVITRPVSNAAMLPTIVRLLGYKIRGGKYPFAPMTSASSRPVISRCWDPDQCISYIKGHYQFIHFFDEQPDAYYDLAADPGEKHNIIDTLGQKTRDRLVSYLHEWQLNVDADYAREHIPAPTRPRKAGAE